MRKPGAQRQKEHLARLKEKYFFTFINKKVWTRKW